MKLRNQGEVPISRPKYPNTTLKLSQKVMYKNEEKSSG